MRKYLWLLLLLIPVIVWSSPPSRTYTYVSGSLIKPDEVTVNEDNIFNYLNNGIDKIANNAVTTDNILDGTIVNGDISGSAGIVYSKLSLTGTITNTDISSSASIADSKLATISTAGKVSASALPGLTLPSGAMFFMLTGSCPAGSTDVTATYSGKSVRINAVQGSTGGSDSLSIAEANLPSHTHAAGTLTGGAHTHDTWIVTSDVSTDAGFQHSGLAWNPTGTYQATGATRSDGAVAVTGSTGAIGSGTAATITNPYVTAKCCSVD